MASLNTIPIVYQFPEPQPIKAWKALYHARECTQLLAWRTTPYKMQKYKMIKNTLLSKRNHFLLSENEILTTYRIKTDLWKHPAFAEFRCKLNAQTSFTAWRKETATELQFWKYHLLQLSKTIKIKTQWQILALNLKTPSEWKVKPGYTAQTSKQLLS